MRRLAVIVVWMLAVAGIVVAVGLRVRASRLADARQTLRAWLPEVPLEVTTMGTVVGRDAGYVQVELRADARWIRTFAQRNGFTPSDSVLTGMKAERWVLTETRRPGAIAHILLPRTGPALVTITGP